MILIINRFNVHTIIIIYRRRRTLEYGFCKNVYDKILLFVYNRHILIIIVLNPGTNWPQWKLRTNRALTTIIVTINTPRAGQFSTTATAAVKTYTNLIPARPVEITEETVNVGNTVRFLFEFAWAFATWRGGENLWKLNSVARRKRAFVRAEYTRRELAPSSSRTTAADRPSSERRTARIKLSLLFVSRALLSEGFSLRQTFITSTRQRWRYRHRRRPTYAFRTLFRSLIGRWTVTQWTIARSRQKTKNINLLRQVCLRIHLNNNRIKYLSNCVHILQLYKVTNTYIFIGNNNLSYIIIEYNMYS